MSASRIFFVLATLTLIGCSPYPRFGRYGSTTPKEQLETAEWRRTEDYLKFGMAIQKYLGRPYAGHSRFQPGMDCSMFTQEVMRAWAKITLPRSAEEQYWQGTDVPHGRLLYGDLVFFTTERDKISHVGIYVGFNQFIHASTSQGVILSSLSEKYWAQRYVGARRILQ